MTVKNASGSDITIQEAPKKIVVLPVWAAEMTLDLVDTGRVAGLSSYMDSSVTTALADTAKKVEKRVASEAEAILGLTPDLVVLDTFNDADGSLAKTLTDAGVTVLTLASPVTYEEITDRLTTLSKALFAADKGDKLVSDMQAKLDAVKAKVKDVPRKRAGEGDVLRGLLFRGRHALRLRRRIAFSGGCGSGRDDQRLHRAALLKRQQGNGGQRVEAGGSGSARRDLRCGLFGDGGRRRGHEDLDPRGRRHEDGPGRPEWAVIALTEKYRGSTSQYMV